MKISRRWLRHFIHSSAQLPTDDTLAARLTNRGFEIETVTPAGDAAGIVLGKILSVSAHPQASRLNLCGVDIGGATLDIVCGAPNVAVGALVAVAPPGARVGGAVMQKRDIRGVESAGMICSAKELGAGGDGDGIMIFDRAEGGAVVDGGGESAPLAVGDGLDDYLFLSDVIFAAGLTPNRGDCFCHLGMAREVAAIAGGNLAALYAGAPSFAETPQLADVFPVRIDDKAKDACPYYGCVVIRGVDCSRPTPWWMRTLLERCGARSINAAVDVTNYVMLALGQPLHAFDLDKLSKGICVRFAAAGEKVALLDGSEAVGRADTLLIADAQGGVALGGVMGGLDSMVCEDTKNILLEGAFFSPAAVRGRTQQFNLTSEAAFRFERGVDSRLPPRALALGARLIAGIGGGQFGPLQTAGTPPPSIAPIHVGGKNIRALIGAKIATATAKKYLSDLQIPTVVAGDELTVSPPSWRFDLEQPADVAEEVVRSWGYDKLPEIMPHGQQLPPILPPQPFAPSRVRRRFAELGFLEAITYAFVPPKWEQMLSTDEAKLTRITNPISEDMSVMRTTLLGGLLDRALFNLHHRQENIKLFELGRCFGGEGEDWRDEQPLLLAGVAIGATQAAHWARQVRQNDFFDVKGWLESFLGADALFMVDEVPPFLHPGQSVRIVAAKDGAVLGAAGVLHPQTAAAWGFRRIPLVFELKLQSLMELCRLPQAAVPSHFPLVERDLSVMAKGQTAEAVLSCARNAAQNHPFVGVFLFDRYEGDSIMGKEVCYGVRLQMQGTTENLTEDDINCATSRVLSALHAAGFSLRAGEGAA